MGVFLYRHKDVRLDIDTRVYPWVSLITVAIILASPRTGTYDQFIDMFSVTVIFPMLVLLASRSAVSRIAPVLLVLGAASYPIYVFHLPLGLLAMEIAGDMVKAHTPVGGVMFVLAIIAFAFWVETKIDIPLRNRISLAVFRSKRTARR